MNEAIDRLIAVVVLYNCRIEDSKSIQSINESLGCAPFAMDVVVYDNSPYSEIESGSKFSKGQFNIHYFHDASNPGVSKAFNVAAEYAKRLQKKWILLLDQDTSFPLECISSYLQAIEQHPTISLFVPILKLSSGTILSPSRYRFKRGFAIKEIVLGINSLKQISPVNSGMLINLDAFTKAGGYNEKIKLDFSDFQFIERFKKVSESFYIINMVVLQEFSDEMTDVIKLNERFAFYCDGAKNCTKHSLMDSLTYFIVVLLRATSLVSRTRNIVFYKTFIQSYLC